MTKRDREAFAAYMREWKARPGNAEKVRAKHRARYAADPVYRERCKKSAREAYRKARANGTFKRDRTKQIVARQQLKALVMSKYGERCVCCGETCMQFLTIDHINNDGAEHRRKLRAENGGGYVQLYTWLASNNFPDGFQVLCFNCNSGKYLNKGICPHQTERKVGFDAQESTSRKHAELASFREQPLIH